MVLMTNMNQLNIRYLAQGTIIAKENWEFNKMVRDDLRFPFFFQIQDLPIIVIVGIYACVCLGKKEDNEKVKSKNWQKFESITFNLVVACIELNGPWVFSPKWGFSHGSYCRNYRRDLSAT